MRLANWDSRAIWGGTDIKRLSYPSPQPIETSALIEQIPIIRVIRVVVGNFGSFYRLSAPDLDMVVDDESFEQAWSEFLSNVRERKDGACLTFDVAPTRPEEVAEGLNASEVEDWSGVMDGDES
ncbi:MAG: hypothetical protein GY869_23760 [Planctomycetes bacterium]|nr:hypothetical protein [Planctomycetota bacterium]